MSTATFDEQLRCRIKDLIYCIPDNFTCYHETATSTSLRNLLESIDKLDPDRAGAHLRFIVNEVFDRGSNCEAWARAAAFVCAFIVNEGSYHFSQLLPQSFDKIGLAQRMDTIRVSVLDQLKDRLERVNQVHTGTLVLAGRLVEHVGAYCFGSLLVARLDHFRDKEMKLGCNLEILMEVVMCVGKAMENDNHMLGETVDRILEAAEDNPRHLLMAIGLKHFRQNGWRVERKSKSQSRFHSDTYQKLIGKDVSDSFDSE